MMDRLLNMDGDRLMMLFIVLFVLALSVKVLFGLAMSLENVFMPYMFMPYMQITKTQISLCIHAI